MSPSYFHGSPTELDIGLPLRARAGGYVSQADPELETVFERVRPDVCIPRAEAVFLVEDPDDIDPAGGSVDFAYEVTPVGPTGRHDLAWYSEAQMALSHGDKARADLCAKAYWAGTPFENPDHSLFEILAREATVSRSLDAAPSFR